MTWAVVVTDSDGKWVSKGGTGDDCWCEMFTTTIDKLTPGEDATFVQRTAKLIVYRDGEGNLSASAGHDDSDEGREQHADMLLRAIDLLLETHRSPK